MTDWTVERLSGDAVELHGRDALVHGTRVISVLDVTAPALVLGSTQDRTVADSSAVERAQVDLVRRRTGGGAVYLDPHDAVWIDVVIPPSDTLWRDDVARAFHWLGRVWVHALGDLGVEGVAVNENAVCHSVLGRLICFAGFGFGEVIGPVGKIVGLSQRRTRAGAWFQCVVLRRWAVEPYAALLAPGLVAVTDDPARELAAVAVQPVEVDRHRLVDAFVTRLTSTP
jgi:hypothetical protein